MTLRFATLLSACQSRRAIISVVTAALGLALEMPAQAQSNAPLPIQPMTSIGADGAGYLADPQPIHLAPSTTGDAQLLSGTTPAVVSCAYPLKPSSCSWTPIKMSLGLLAQSISVPPPGLGRCPQGEVCFTNFQNIDLFQDDTGRWQAAVTIGVRTARHPRHWTFIAHAHPVGTGSGGAFPRSWAADTILHGSLSDPRQGNYDAKYFEDGGRLYLLYVDTIKPEPALRNAIFLQPLQSFTQPAPERRVMLLRPGTRYGAIRSEDFASTQAKLVEAPYISKIGGKYALVYSTGSYLTPGYKAGVAWSDTLLPQHGFYRKVLQLDEAGVWGRPGAHEVHYLVQSATPDWPNFTGPGVIGPGVASAIQAPSRAWFLFFNAYAADDMTASDGAVEANHRRPYYLRLQSNVPAGVSVSSASDAQLATWLTIQLP
jgi:hypothetical protein